MTEEWRQIPGFPDYEVSDKGRVRSWRPWNGRPLPHLREVSDNGRGYLRVGLYDDAGKLRTMKVHRLVMRAFVGPLPEGQECRHLDGDKTNNTLANLEYGTRSENTHDKVRHGVYDNGRINRTECRRGHPYSGDNLYIAPGTGYRRCRACDAAARRRRTERGRA